MEGTERIRSEAAPGRDRATPSPPTPPGQGQLQLLVGLPAHRCGLTRFLQPRAMAFTWGPLDVRRPVTGSAGPTWEGAMAVHGTATAPEHGPQAVVPVPWPPPGTRPPWQGCPRSTALLRRTPLRLGGRGSSPRDDARAHERRPTGRTPLGMGVPALGTHRLPVQPQRANPGACPSAARPRARAAVCVGWYSP
jgi:hypothetical protein